MRKQEGNLSPTREEIKQNQKLRRGLINSDSHTHVQRIPSISSKFTSSLLNLCIPLPQIGGYEGPLDLSRKLKSDSKHGTSSAA
jgi:hypothetical protein